jgi:Protein of unknown function (DUF2589)
MISLKSFVRAIHSAIMQAHDSLMTSNVEILNEFFHEAPKDTNDKDAGDKVGEKTLKPKNVIVEYPVLTASGKLETAEVHVPLITLVPLSISQIEKAKLTVNFDLEAVDGELQLTFMKQSGGGLFSGKPKIERNNMEITIAPIQTSEGLKLLVEGYEAILKRQIP